MLLAFSSRDRLVAHFGADGFERVAAALDAYSDALYTKRIANRFVFIDDPQSVNEYGIAPVKLGSWRDAAAGVRGVAKALDSQGYEVDNVVIVGGHRIIPFCDLPNPALHRSIDTDMNVWSDNPYGAFGAGVEADFLEPEAAVGRIIDGGGRNPQSLVDNIEWVIRHHTNPRQLAGGCVFSNIEWGMESAKVAREIPGEITWRQSPGYRVTAANAGDLERRYLYFNLHGFLNSPEWSGVDAQNARYVDAVRPGALRSCTLEGCRIVAENCYGAWVIGKTARNSCAVRAVAQGATTFLGATGLAYGSYLSHQIQLGNAAVLARDFLRHNSAGASSGEALQRARGRVAAGATVYDQKTALQFVLFGDPTL